MKRTPLQRGTGLKRTGFSPGARREPKRKPINKKSKKAKGEEKEAEAFRRDVLLSSFGICERCLDVAVHAHHMCLRSRSRGHEWKHDPARNGAALCSPCHSEIHDNTPEDRDEWIKPIRWLDAGGRLQDTTTETP